MKSSCSSPDAHDVPHIYVYLINLQHMAA